MGRLWGMDFDEKHLTRLLRHSAPRSKFWNLVRRELKDIGRWKYRPRGDARKGGLASMAKQRGKR